MAACVPTVERTGHRGVAFSADTITELYPCVRVVARIGASAAEPRYA
jgi:D-aminopeptidase